MAAFTCAAPRHADGGALHDVPTACLSTSSNHGRVVCLPPWLLLALSLLALTPAIALIASKEALGASPANALDRAPGAEAADDNDGVAAANDACASTPAGQQTDAAGCSIAQLCPCDRAGDPWQNHRAYLSCVAQAGQDFIDLGLIATTEQEAILLRAGRSRCGKKS